MTLVEFLTARVEEDAAWMGCPGDGEYRGCGDCSDRMDREVAAKRAIVAHVLTWKHTVVEDCWYTCPAATEERDGGTNCNDAAGDECDCGTGVRRGEVLRRLASVYADHPSYREEWRP